MPVPVEEPPQDPDEERREREREEMREAVQALRRRGAPVYRPEPDVEPFPRPPSPPRQAPNLQVPAPPQIPQVFQDPRPPAVAQYLDDAVIAGQEPAAQAPQGQLQRDGYAFGGPQRGVARGDRPPQRPPRVQHRGEVLREVQRQEAERRFLDLPPVPPLNANPDWEAPPNQPALRHLRREASEWGREISALHQIPPAYIRRDFYQHDPGRGDSFDGIVKRVYACLPQRAVDYLPRSAWKSSPADVGLSLQNLPGAT